MCSLIQDLVQIVSSFFQAITYFKEKFYTKRSIIDTPSNIFKMLLF